MQERLQLLKNTLQIPLAPVIAGSSPLWIHIELIRKRASLPQIPDSPLSLSALQFRGQMLHDAKGSKSCVKRVMGNTLFTLRDYHAKV